MPTEELQNEIFEDFARGVRVALATGATQRAGWLDRLADDIALDYDLDRESAERAARNVLDTVGAE